MSKSIFFSCSAKTLQHQPRTWGEEHRAGPYLKLQQACCFHWCWASVVVVAPCDQSQFIFAYTSSLNGHGCSLHCARCIDAYDQLLDLVPAVCSSFLSSHHAKYCRCCKSQEQTISYHIYIYFKMSPFVLKDYKCSHLLCSIASYTEIHVH